MYRYIIIVFAMAAGISPVTFADTLIIDRIPQEKLVNMPQKGMSKNQVTVQFGEPLLKHASVGTPPITRWDYQNFTVYFEYNHVITSVVIKTSEQDYGPRPVSDNKP